jgi:hypothetical protein
LDKASSPVGDTFRSCCELEVHILVVARRD